MYLPMDKSMTDYAEGSTNSSKNQEHEYSDEELEMFFFFFA